MKVFLKLIFTLIIFNIYKRLSTAAFREKKGPNDVRRNAATAWIQRYMELSSDSKPSSSRVNKIKLAETKTDHSSESGEEDVKIIPFDTFSEFYNEYSIMTDLQSVKEEHIAKVGTFRRALDPFIASGKLRYARCKGSMGKCDVCNNIKLLLRSTRKGKTLMQEHREILFKYLRVHREQQSVERFHAESVRGRCKEEQEGNPIGAYILIDGMTEYTTLTPKSGKRGYVSKEYEGCAKFKSRLIDAEVVCGANIDTNFHYYTDDMIGGGANTTIEVVRRSIRDLANLLKKEGKVMPKKLYLQFDNCGENKVNL